MTKRILLTIKSFYPIVCLLFCILISSTQPALASENQQDIQPMEFTLDFETGDLRGWTKTGTAFDCQPTLGDNPTARRRGQPSKHQGRHWIGGFEKYQGKPGQKPGNIQGDGPRGTLTSPSFTIPSGSLSFLVGGGSSMKTRIELLVSGKSVLQASGRNTETMHRVTWNLSPYTGKTGRIRIVDDASGGWGHINVDDLKFSSLKIKIAEESKTPPAASNKAVQKELLKEPPSTRTPDQGYSGKLEQEETFDDFASAEDEEKDNMVDEAAEPEEEAPAMPVSDSPEEQRYLNVMARTAKELRLGVTLPQRKSKTRYELVDSRYYAGLSLTKLTGLGDEFIEALRMMTGNPNTTLETFTRELCEHMQQKKQGGAIGDGLQYTVKDVEGIEVCYILEGTEENIMENRARAIVNGEVELMTVSYPYEQKPLNAVKMMRAFVKNYLNSAK